MLKLAIAMFYSRKPNLTANVVIRFLKAMNDWQKILVAMIGNFKIKTIYR